MKSNRHMKILQLIQEHRVETQEELLRLLRSEGFGVTQATVSRDIKELRLVKTQSPDGGYRYAVAHSDAPEISSKFFTLFSDSARSVDFAGNLVVVHCISGMAQGICAAMDAMHWEGMVGTLAGDDTILIVARTEHHAANLANKLNQFLTSR